MKRRGWQKSMLSLSIVLCCSPSLSNGFVANGAGVISRQIDPLPVRSKLYGRIQNHRLWISQNSDNDSSNADGQSTTDDLERTDEKLTLKKASTLLSTFWSMAYPYYKESQPGRRLFYGMILLTLMNSGVSVAFSYISKDFWNALSSKDVNEFYSMMVKFGSALVVGAPIAVLYR